MHSQSGYLILLLALLAFAVPAYGKGVTVGLSITGPNLEAPIHTSEPEIIGVSVWGGDFANWEMGTAPEPSSDLDRYLVHFWVQVPRGTVQMKYVLWYVWDPESQQAFVHLPGPGDIWYRTNTFSILREGRDGHWFHAAEQWGKTLKRVLRIEQPSKKALQQTFDPSVLFADTKNSAASKAAEPWCQVL